ncbi:MAG: endonuclease domain-containing protein [Bacteroidales bacterium]
MKDINTVLIAIMNSKIDFEIAKTHNWYRIPVTSAPKIVKDGKIQIIAFYLTQKFNDEKYTINHYGIVNNVSIKKRKEFFPFETPNIKSEKYYFKIDFQPLIKLEHPIISLRGRRILFIPTTKEKFFNSKEINNLFNDSILEDKLWEEFKEKDISAERQFFYSIDKKNNYLLDFAIFCKTRNINVECDGNKYHMGNKEIQYDKNRNNYLESKGWSVLRFTTKNLTQELNQTVNIICNTINKYGGIQDELNLYNYRFIRPDSDSQLYLFD